MSDPRQTAQEALGGDRAALRPWHVEVGEDGGLTAIVGYDGRLVCDTAARRAPVHPEYRAGVDGDVAADAQLIVAAVNLYDRVQALLGDKWAAVDDEVLRQAVDGLRASVSTRAAVELATVRETRTL